MTADDERFLIMVVLTVDVVAWPGDDVEVAPLPAATIVAPLLITSSLEAFSVLAPLNTIGNILAVNTLPCVEAIDCCCCGGCGVAEAKVVVTVPAAEEELEADDASNCMTAGGA